MSDQLTAPGQPGDQRGARAGGRAGALQFVLALVLLAAVGAAAGVVWEWLWTPSVGVVVDHQWVAENEAALSARFSSTGWFVAVATVAGVLGGLLVALFLDRVPLLTLLAVVVGSAIATWVMLYVGAALGPPDPDHLALAAKDGTHLPAQLQVSAAAPEDLPDLLQFLRHSPLIAFPTGALVGLTLVFFGLTARRHLAVDREVDDRPAG